jgi:4-diphosphocytidyl-2-C-methyl-D-erythritol kinase
MGPGADSRTGRQAQNRGRGQGEEWPGSDQRAIERILRPDTGGRPGFAPAKINLFLHVGEAAADGFHPICSLVAFADAGDELWIDEAADSGVVIDGPFSSGLSAGPDNLAVRARDLLLRPRSAKPFGLRLTKALPLASGIGGGSADAAAVMRLTAIRLGLDLDSGEMRATASSLGSDVAVCLRSRAALMTGRGETLLEPPQFPSLNAVLVNPGVASPTAEAYRAFDAGPPSLGADCPWPQTPLASVREVAQHLAGCRNDLEAPVARRLPAVAATLDSLRAQPETLIARMSGSGATCFALVEDEVSAVRLALRLTETAPDWWVRAVTLAGTE